jgi:hypothetical protein
MRLRHVLLGSVLALVVGSATPAVAQGDLSTAQQAYRASADRICQAGNVRLVTAAQSYELQNEVSRSGARSKKTKVAKPGDVVRFVQEVAAAEMTDQIDRLKALSVPAPDRTAMAKLFADAEKALGTLRSKPGEVAYADPFKGVVKQFRSLGFSECGRNASLATTAK